jgi:hypothetical protein
VDRGDGLADRGRVLEGERLQRDLGAVDELVHDRSCAVERDLARERRHGEREPRADARAEGPQGDEIGGLLRLCAFAAGDPDGPVPAIATGEEGGVEVTARRAERLRSRDVQTVHGRRRERR